MDAAAAEAFKQNSPIAQWGYGAGDIVRNAQTLTKVCIPHSASDTRD